MKVLYICTHNRCRSILSEAITNFDAGDVITARSAGSQPVGEVHPLTLKYLKAAGVTIEGLVSESWDAFSDFAPDVVITVCDSAAGETCPLWMGSTTKVHWGLSDPSKLDGSEEEKAAAFNATIGEIRKRVSELKLIANQQLSPSSLKAALQKLGAE